MQDVADEFVEETLEPEGRFGFKVYELMCGCSVESRRTVIGPSPGGAPPVSGLKPWPDYFYEGDEG